VYFTPPLKELELELFLELGIGAGVKEKLERWDYRAEEKVDDIFSRVDTIHQRDRRIGGQTLDDSKDRAYA